MSEENTICRFVLTIEQADALHLVANSVAAHKASNPEAARAALTLQEAMDRSKSKGMPVVGLAMPLSQAQALTVLLSGTQSDCAQLITARSYWALEVLYAQRRAVGDDQHEAQRRLTIAA